MDDQKMKKVPPDGGWGYVVIFAAAFAMFFLIPSFQSLGFLMRPIFQEMELTGQEISTILNLHSGAGFTFGIFHGPLAKIFGYRANAMIGAALSSFGLFMTSFSHSVLGFMIYLGIINAIGIFTAYNATTFALNSYFDKKRTYATGIAYTISGIGSAVTPLILSKSLAFYGARGTVMLHSAVLLNVIVFAMLMQPVEWHYKNEEPALENGAESSLSTKTTPQMNGDPGKDENCDKEDEGTEVETTPLKPEEQKENEVKKEEWNTSCWQYLVKWFDLDLLKDPVFMSILLGLSFAISGEITFSMLYPIILGDKGFETDDIAKIMSVTACVDIVFRFIVPMIQTILKWTSKEMYIMTLIMLISSRFCLLLVSSFWSTFAVGAIIGVAKGFRTVYAVTLIPEYVPNEKLPSAQGLQTVFNGIVILSLGPLVGKLRDYYGDFSIVIYLTNFLSFIALCIWVFDRFVVPKQSEIEKG